ncbi:MAG: ribonuclease III [Acidimicrobiales bacterium]
MSSLRHGEVAPGEVAQEAQDPTSELGSRLGRRFCDPSLAGLALSHRSWCAERPGSESNERLEFLGDAVLGLVVAAHCYDAYPQLAEGALAKLRSAVVNATVLSEVSASVGLGDLLRLGKGEEASGGRAKRSLLADAMEAVIGAVYLDGGYEAARSLIIGLLGRRIEAAVQLPHGFDHKSRLQERAQGQGVGLPVYMVEGSGPDHGRSYRAVVLVGGLEVGRGTGTSKKDAEQDAARRALRAMRDA